MAKPTVVLDHALAHKLSSLGLSPDWLIEVFEDWKTDWPEFEYLNEFFGRNTAYVLPKVFGKSKLMHVHIPPDDENELRRWNNLNKVGREKTSDRCLIYIEGKIGVFLLIALFGKNAHGIASDPARRMMMEAFAEIAEEFITFGQYNLSKYYQYGDDDADADDEGELEPVPLIHG